MGPNGAGKSTLAKILSGHPSYEVESVKFILKEMKFWSLNLKKELVLGYFMSFQYPPEIPESLISNFSCMPAMLEEKTPLTERSFLNSSKKRCVLSK